MKPRRIISSAPLLLCMLLTLGVIGAHESAASYQDKKDQPKVDAAAPKTQAPAEGKAAPAAGAPKANTRPPAAPKGGGRGATPAAQAAQVGEDEPPQPRTAAQQSSQPAEEGQQPRPNQPAGAGTQRGQANPSPTPAAASSQQEESWLDLLLYWALWVLGVLGVLLVLGLVGYGVKTFVDSSRARTDAHFTEVKRRQDEYARRTRDTLATLDNRVAEVQTELKNMRRILQDENRSVLDAVRRGGPPAPAAYAVAGYSATPPRLEREEQQFPAAAEEYVNKNRRGAVVVKTDFQNGILVQDPEGSGELVLVRDRESPDELLYVVPRIGYFQTKQDFLNYYDRYYECSRPSAGTVWIVQPAVVDRVSGGWSLREKGELEVR